MKSSERKNGLASARTCGFSILAGGALLLASGQARAQYTSMNAQLMSHIPLSGFSGSPTGGAGCWGYTSPSGREYALMGLRNSLAVVEITNPTTPVIVGQITHTNSSWCEIKTYGDNAYVTNESGGGVDIVDLSNVDNGVVTLVQRFIGGGVATSHTLFINTASGYLYLNGSNLNGGRLVAYNLANPDAPVLAGQASSTVGTYVHDSQVVSYTSGPYAGKEIAFSCNGSTGLDIYDVTNKANITRLSRSTYPNLSYCHQGWLSADRVYFYINDETDGINETVIFNVTNLSLPVFVGTYNSGVPAADHNCYVHNGKMYEADYRAGLRVFDLTVSPTNPPQIAWFDTYPANDLTGYNGAWSPFPFFASGSVLISDIEGGLFVVRIGPPLLVIDYPNGRPPLLNPSGDSIQVTITNQGGTLLPGTAKLNFDNGAGFTAVDLQPVSGNLYNAVFPASPCGNTIKYFISAQTTSGITVRDPAGAPASSYQATAASSAVVRGEDTMETATPWVVGAPGDTATSGVWVRVDPVGTAAQPEDDHTPAAGVMCWVTGQGVPGGAVGAADIDGGATTLTSPTLDATGGSVPYIEFYRWYSNNTGSNPGIDSMPIQISNNNGSSWVQMELVTENAGAWVGRSFRISDFVPPTNQMKLRLIARDLDPASVVEAGLDDLRIVYYNCQSPIPGDVNGDQIVNIDDLVIVITSWGPCIIPGNCPADVNLNGVVDIDDLVLVITNWG